VADDRDSISGINPEGFCQRFRNIAIQGALCLMIALAIPHAYAGEPPDPLGNSFRLITVNKDGTMSYDPFFRYTKDVCEQGAAQARQNEYRMAGAQAIICVYANELNDAEVAADNVDDVRILSRRGANK
jgi:hypothetical protein